LNYIPGPWMESIQVSKGTSSVMQGYESITGQINVDYKKPENSEKFYANIFGNSNLRFEANLDGALKLNDKLSTMLFFHADDFRNKFDRNGDGFMDLPKVTNINAFNRWDYIKPGVMISRFGIKYLDETRNGGQMDFDKGNFTFDTTGISEGIKKYGIGVRTQRLEAFWKNGFFFANHPQSSLGLILSGINHLQNGFYGINQYSGHEQSLFANLVFTTSFRKETHKIGAGVSYLLDNFNEDYLQHQLSYGNQGMLPAAGLTDSIYRLTGDHPVNFDMNRTEWSAGGYFEYTFNYKDKLTIIAGLRGDYDNFWGFFVTPRLHLKYDFNGTTTLRGSVGRGYRTANVLAENSNLFVSQRKFVFSEELNQENAWNFGLNFTKEFKLFRHKATLELDAYRTAFGNEVVADVDSLPGAVFFYNLHGRSFANSLQAQFIFEPVHNFSITAAFRYNDVRQTIGGKLVEKPMVSSYKGLLTLSYATRGDSWKFDLTGQLNGPMRLPNSSKLPSDLQQPSHSKPWINLLAQVTKKFKFVEVYVGGENLANFTQPDPIVDPAHPYYTYFDGSMVWGPLVGITAYAGVRLTIK
ncbi:MAG TPA: TonB-dependent receptor, partial [Bacteroidales bacterium]|nr:TonB-dependent receptor [Bacteroidales bacterium]